MVQLCLIYNYAQHYRASIFELVDKEFQCDFVFGDFMGDVKKMDYTCLNGNVTETHTKRIAGGWYWQPQVVSQLFKPYSHYILLGETRALSTWFFCALARLLFPYKKVYFWSHGWYGKESKLETVIKKMLFHLPNGGIFLYGNYARELMIKNGFSPNKLFTIHNSLAYDQQLQLRKTLKTLPIYKDHFQNENKNLLFVGRLTGIKKLDQILMAMNICRRSGHMYNLTLIGGGEKEKELKMQARELGLSDNVWFYGPCYNEAVLGNMIYNADLCVAPGNIGLTAMHAMVFGTPCLTHNSFQWQMPEFEAIKDGETGCFYKMDDVTSLAGSIDDWFLKNSTRRDEIRQACMKEIDNEWTPYFQIKVFKEKLI